MPTLLSIATSSRREFIARFALVPAVAGWLGPDFFRSDYHAWQSQLRLFLRRYSIDYTFQGGGVLACLSDRVPAALQVPVRPVDPTALGNALQTARFGRIWIQGEKVLFRHADSLVTLEHHSSNSPVQDYQHQFLQLSPETGELVDPYGITSQRLPRLVLAAEPAELLIGFEVYLSGLLESALHGLSPTDSFSALERSTLSSRIETKDQANRVYSTIVGGLAALACHLTQEQVNQLLSSELIESTLRCLGSSAEAISKHAASLTCSAAAAVRCLAALLVAFPTTATSPLRTSRSFLAMPTLEAFVQAVRIPRLSSLT